MLEEVRKELERRGRGEIEIYEDEVRKNNGVTLNVIGVRDAYKDKGCHADIRIHFNSSDDVGTIAEQIIESFDSKPNAEELKNVSESFNLDNLYYQAVNAEKNADKEDEACIRMLDLLLIPRVFIKEEEGVILSAIGSADVVRKIMGDTSMAETKERIKENTMRLFPVEREKMNTMITKLLGSSAPDLPDEVDLQVITSRKGAYGVATALLSDEIAKVSEEYGSDVVILPSSIHELLVLPFSADCSLDEVKEMIASVNGSCVLPEEILSYNPYIYSRERGELEVWEK